MVVIFTIIALLVMFVGLMLFMRHILTRNISRATGHIQELSKDYAVKQEEANKRLQKAKEESEKMVAESRQQAQQLREVILKEAEETKKKIVEEARQRGKEITDKAQRNYEFLKGEIEQRIDIKAKEKACELIGHALPEHLLKDIHQLLLQESGKGEFQLKRLTIPEDIHEAKVISAFALKSEERRDLQERLKKQLSAPMDFREEIDPSLMAGFIIQIGHVVIDASLKNRISQAAQNVQQPAA
ncbi:MAG: hypothetical protein A3G91_06275 [Omnitrophica WOR_2 bacterium RIFCSPLOWO2_12_FULL_50_9]|nr:MAG: hypothetical protein A3D87_01085 [Omnitrophica WOR_2 bacterium RIFCSPHIGHO2_02_FULL_50_17]OGX43382.1 MAG: hypothetical protein A3G91_06275 [Omnitrophica WOR_2 bacterium RIFCSPLOWO2_12_FULL_50_9]